MSLHARIPCLDALRSIAVLWVIGFHLSAGEWLPPIPVITPILFSGYAGVDLFFVLSGFLIGGIALREAESTGALRVRRFWSRRWMRTLPAYYATLLGIAVIDVVIGHGFPSAASYLVFAQNYASDLERFGWSWSLCVEEHFYLLLPIAVATLLRFGGAPSPRMVIRIIAASGMALSILSRSVLAYRHDVAHLPWPLFVTTLYALTHCRLDGLAIGLLLTTLKPVSRHGAVAILCAGIVLIVGCVVANSNWTGLFRDQGFAALALGFGGILFGAVNLPWQTRHAGIARFVADLSYALYLVHPIAIRAFHFAIHLPTPIRIVPPIAAMFVASFALRRMVELPTIKLRDRLFPDGVLTKTMATADPPEG